MIRLLEKAMARVAALSPMAQEKIGGELLSHHENLERLREKLDKGIRSLNRGEGRELDMDDVIKRARERYGKE